MITVLTGTQNIQFDRLLKAVLNYAYKRSDIYFNIQAGYFFTSYEAPLNVDIFDFKSQREIDDLISKSELVITHGGTGSIINPLYMNKKVVVVPRLSKYGEHNDDHQREIAEAFESEGYVLTWYGGEIIDDIIEKSKLFKPKKYKSDFHGLRESILSDIESFMHD